MTSVLKPWAGHGDVISGGFALSLDQNREVGGVLAIPCLEWLEDLQTVRAWGDLDFNGRSVLRWSLVGVLAWVVSVPWKSVTGRRFELEIIPIFVLQRVGQRVEIEGTGNTECDDKIGRGNERVGGRIGVVTSSEVAVV